MKVHQETERVSQLEPRRQGDIIRVEYPNGEAGPQLGVVINADCDLAHGKTDGVVAFLPIYRFRDYLSQFWAQGHIEEVTASATQTVLNLVDDNSDATLHSWLITAGAESVSSALLEQKKLKPKQIQKLNTELNRLSICLRTDLDAIAQFQNICCSTSDPAAYARTQITNAKKAMGESHFIISDLVDEPSVGFIIRMRRVYTIPDTDYFMSKSDQMSRSQGDGATAIRIARLTDRYRFKVLQMFSNQYSRIGLTDEITSLSELIIDDLVEIFTGNPE